MLKPGFIRILRPRLVRVLRSCFIRVVRSCLIGVLWSRLIGILGSGLVGVVPPRLVRIILSGLIRILRFVWIRVSGLIRVLGLCPRRFAQYERCRTTSQNCACSSQKRTARNRFLSNNLLVGQSFGRLVIQSPFVGFAHGIYSFLASMKKTSPVGFFDAGKPFRVCRVAGA